MNKRLLLIVSFPLLAGLAARPASALSGTNTGKFHVEHIGDRWWMVDDQGHPLFMKGTGPLPLGQNEWQSEGTYNAYDRVYLSTGTDAFSFTVNLATAAASNVPYIRDVVHPATGKTVSKTGDAIYIGWRLPPTASYFWLDELGVNGKIAWFYSTGTAASPGWKPINGDGKVFSGFAPNIYLAQNPTNLNADGSYYMDNGGYRAPGPGGWEKAYNYQNSSGTTSINPAAANANIARWWKSASGIPTDFGPVPLTAADGSLVDGAPLFYIKGVVTVDFDTAPVLNTLYEREKSFDQIMRRYGVGRSYNDAKTAGLNSLNWRYAQWGLNVEGSYASGITQFPAMPQWQLTGGALYGTWAKELLRPAQCPPKSGKTVQPWWSTFMADFFDPQAEKGFMNAAASGYHWFPSNWKQRYYGVSIEEADFMSAFNNPNGRHVGYVVLAQNPYNPARNDDMVGIHPYADPIVYAKYAMRDFLRYRYKDPDEPMAPFAPGTPTPAYQYSHFTSLSGYELHALNRLNAAWGTSYTSWDTTAGDLLLGTNAWGTGSGFMDEDGTNILTSGCNINYQTNSSIKPGVLKDLDDYAVLFAQQYGYLLTKAMNQQEHPPIVEPLYSGPDFAFRTIGPYVDAFWGTADATIAQKVYDNSHKPFITADYSVAPQDSPNNFGGVVSSVTLTTLDDGSVATEIRWAMGRPYTFSALVRAAFSGGTAPCVGNYLLVRAISWDSITLKGDYSSCVGTYIGVDPFKAPSTQEGRAVEMINHWDSIISERGTAPDDSYFTIGLDHWQIVDDTAWNTMEAGNFGYMSALGNAYDGSEAKASTSTVMYGGEGPFLAGGESADYGNLLTAPVNSTWASNKSLVDYWHSFDNPDTLPGNPSKQMPPQPPFNLKVVGRQSNPIGVGLGWDASPSYDNPTGYTLYRSTFSTVFLTESQLHGLIPGALVPTPTGMTPSSVQAPLAAGTAYFFRVTASNVAGESLFSSEVSTITTDIAGLPAPTLDLPDYLPRNATLHAGYPAGYAMDHFEWAILEPSSMSYTGSGTGSGIPPFQVKSTVMRFASPAYSADLGPQHVPIGRYIIAVKAVDHAGNSSPETYAVTTLVNADVNTTRVYPNPWRADRDTGHDITFDQLTLNATIRIFTVSGHGIRTLTASHIDPITQNISITWDRKNDWGDTVASGLYFYLLTDAQGGKHRGQLAIIR